ncbi:glycosyltransferase family 2 protein [Portibacter lacus]|uniref:Glycosyl hydrolase n=1 Tax=Portibacter lacus TaxID=1099794 RepID=A0AA37WFY2_9BACT|nr:glycosyltransferase family 2 protein [Portibacter lacus]GLR19243.1 glycosyl hydrolase [Portibacter lacus]
MSSKQLIDVIIPAYNEEESIGRVINDIPKDLVRDIIVCENNCTDSTAQVALAAGAIVVSQPIKGYGNACLKGMEYIANNPIKPDIVVFLDGDYSDHPEQMPDLVRPIIEDDLDFVIASRAMGNLEKGAMMPQQVFGNWLATTLIKLFYKVTFTDLGPFRAIKYGKLLEIEMEDKTFGWTVEMQVKAAKHRFKFVEIPAIYRKRIGVSKVSGTVKGTILAGHKILWTIFKLL